jgi:hypothetical protein
MVARTRKATRNTKGLAGRAYAPVNHALRFATNSVGAVTKGAENIVRNSLTIANKIGKSFAHHLNGTVKNVVTRKQRKQRSRKERSRKERERNRKQRSRKERNRQ